MRRLDVLFAFLLLVGCDGAKKSDTAQSPTPSSADSVAGEACTADQFSLVPGVEGAGGSAIIGVEIRHRGAPCTLRATAELQILDGAGRLLVANGNPSKASIERRLPADQGVMWSWQNWCGAPSAIRYVVTIGEKQAALDSRAGPRCDAPGVSILQFLS